MGQYAKKADMDEAKAPLGRLVSTYQEVIELMRLELRA